MKKYYGNWQANSKNPVYKEGHWYWEEAREVDEKQIKSAKENMMWHFYYYEEDIL